MAQIALFDANALVHRAYHAVTPLTTSKGELTNAVFGFTTMLLKTFAEHRVEYAAVAFDRSAPTFRHTEYADYKANRARTADDLAPQFKRVRQVVEGFAIPIFEQAGFEADDLLGTLARQAVERDVDALVVTGDTDALQLVGPRTRVFTPSRGMTEAVLYDEARVRERYGLEPRQIVDYKALKGDPSDNIKGVPGVGEKTAQRLLERYDTIERLVELPPDLEPKLRPTIEAHVEALRLGKRLVTILRDVPVELDLERSLIGDFDRASLIALLRELEFRSLIDRLPPPRTPLTPRAGQPSPDGGSRPRQIGLFDQGSESAGTTVVPPPARAGSTSVAGAYRLVTEEAALQELARELAAADRFAFRTKTEERSSFADALVGLAFATGPGAGWYVPLGHRDDFPQLPIERVRAALAESLTNPALPKYGHNLKYDLQVLHRSGFRIEGIAFDSTIAAFVLDNSVRAFGLRDLAANLLQIELPTNADLVGSGKNRVPLVDVPPEQVMSHAAAEVDVALRLGVEISDRLARTGLLEFFRTVELPCIPVLTRMEEVGVRIDTAYLRQMSEQLAERVTECERQIYEHVGHQFNVNSPIQLGKILFDELRLPRGKKTRTGWSTDAETLEELRGVHPVIDSLFEYRQISKLKSTYVDALPTMVSPRDGRLHTWYNQVGANTGRMSSAEPNLQNIPIRTDLGRDVRRGFVAEPGFVFVGADYSQVELRILAHITGDAGLIRAFAESQDIHRATAATIFGVTSGTVTADQRRLAKVVNFGIAYGLGEHGLAVSAGISRGEAAEFIRAYLERYPGIARYIVETKMDAEHKGYVETLMGRRIHLPEIASVNRTIRAQAERRAINAPIQGSNADFMKVAMARIADAIDRRQLGSRLILQVHDELVFEAPRDEVAPLGELAKEVMCGVYPLEPALEVEIKVGTNWCDVE